MGELRPDTENNPKCRKGQFGITYSLAASMSCEMLVAGPHRTQKNGRRFAANLLPFDFVQDFRTCYFNSMRTTSRGLSLKFSDRCSSAGITMAWPAVQLRSSVRPSGNVNLPWFAHREPFSGTRYGRQTLFVHAKNGTAGLYRLASRRR